MPHEQTTAESGHAALAGVRIDAGDAWAGAIRLDLTRQEFRALTLLVEQRGRTVTRDAFAEAVWPEYGGDVADASVDQLLSRLRRKLAAADPALRRALVTLKGRGFRLEDGAGADAREPRAEASSRPAVRPASLPAPLTSFIGREDELARLTAMLATTRLLTLTGAGGCGKTRLAIALAERAAPAYPDGALWVELATLASPELVPQAICTALGLGEQAEATPLDLLLGVLCGQRSLLVLDNCEHLVDACAAIAERLLRGCPKLSILATSREALRVAGEQSFRVQPLAVAGGEAARLIAELTQSDAVRLFIARATDAEPGFVLTLENAASVVEICRRLDGIPLAIELAAAWAPFLSPDEIAARLDDRLQLLTRAARTALPHQQTLRAAIDWSFDLLSPQEQRLFRRLAVFRGGAGLEAAEAVCAEDDERGIAFLRDLTELVDKSLVVAETRSGITRYTQLETIRQYAAEKLEASGEAAATGLRHAAWYADLAERAERELRGPDQSVWLAWLEREHDNLRTVLDLPAAELVLRTAGALGRFWEVRGYLSEGRQRLERALEQNAAAAPAIRAKVLHAAGLLAQHQGAQATARTLYEQALAVRQELGDTLGAANELNNLGILARDGGEGERAAELHEQALALRREGGDALGIAMSLNNLGILARDRADYARAATLYEESLQRCQALGDQQGVASALVNLGEVAHLCGDQPRAIELIGQGLSLYHQLGDKQRLAFAIEDLAAATGALGRPLRAAQLWGAASALREEIGAPLAAVDTAEYAAFLAGLREALGAAAFAEALREGAALPLDQLCITGAAAPSGGD